MTGIRKVIGMGKLARDTEKISEMPYKDGSDSLRKSPLDIVEAGELIKRFGSGLEITIEEEREIEYVRDLGFREYTVASPGMYSISFSMSGYFSPRDFAQWGDALFLNESIELSNSTKVFDKKVGGTPVTLGEYPDTNKEGYGFIGPDDGRGSRLEVPNQLLLKYKEDVGKEMVVRVIYPERLNNPNDFAIDIATVKYNEHTPKGGANEVGVLCGCIFESGSFTYEVGSDMGLKFSVDGFALRAYKNLVKGADTPIDFRDKIDEVSDDIYVTGCLSIKKTKGDVFEEIAYTDNAQFSIDNSIEKLPDCGQLVYSGGIMGNLEIGLELQTYSNEPDRYLPAFYGVKFEKDALGNYDKDITYSVAKSPKPIDAFLVRSTDSGYTGDDLEEDYTKFFDIVVRRTYIGGINNAYSTDSKIMDEPTTKPFFGWVAYGYKVE